MNTYDRSIAVMDKYSVLRITEFSMIEKLYHKRLKKDFAADELRPLGSIKHSWDLNAYECYGLFDGHEAVGYAFFVHNGRHCLLDFFAISEELRGKGLGSYFLHQLNDKIKETDCILVEVENPDAVKDRDARRKRESRLQFYLRNGFQKTELTSILFGVNYRILEKPLEISRTTEELSLVYTEMYRSILPALFFHTKLRIHVDGE